MYISDVLSKQEHVEPPHVFLCVCQEDALRSVSYQCKKSIVFVLEKLHSSELVHLPNDL